MLCVRGGARTLAGGCGVREPSARITLVGVCVLACIVANPYHHTREPEPHEGFERARKRAAQHCDWAWSRGVEEGCREYVRQVAACAE